MRHGCCTCRTSAGTGRTWWRPAGTYTRNGLYTSSFTSHSPNLYASSTLVTMAFAKQTDVDAVAQQSEVKRLMALDTTPWYKRPNLRTLYLTLIPTALGCEMTSGYDGSIMNGLQAVGPWNTCKQRHSRDTWLRSDYHCRLQQSRRRPVRCNVGSIQYWSCASDTRRSLHQRPCWKEALDHYRICHHRSLTLGITCGMVLETLADGLLRSSALSYKRRLSTWRCLSSHASSWV